MGLKASHSKIVRYWADDDTNIGQYVRNQCFACGSPLHLHRSHIEPRVNGGSDELENLHILCIRCHVDSEYLTSEQYWKWYLHKLEHEFDFGMRMLYDRMCLLNIDAQTAMDTL
jgi:5-methylcytosine-specific restriction endonuclease McrA